MALACDDVRGIADYARIWLDDDELLQMTEYLNDAVGLLSPIRALDLNGVEPTFHPVGDLASVVAADEPDAYERSLSTHGALRNATSTRDGMFRVPSILGTPMPKGGEGA